MAHTAKNHARPYREGCVVRHPFKGPHQSDRTVAIVYFSAQGHTHQLAEAVAEGVALVPGVAAKLLRIGRTTCKGAASKTIRPWPQVPCRRRDCVRVPQHTWGRLRPDESVHRRRQFGLVSACVEGQTRRRVHSFAGAFGGTSSTRCSAWSSTPNSTAWFGSAPASWWREPARARQPLVEFHRPMAQSDMQQQSLQPRRPPNGRGLRQANRGRRGSLEPLTNVFLVVGSGSGDLPPHDSGSWRSHGPAIVLRSGTRHGWGPLASRFRVNSAVVKRHGGHFV